MFEENIIRDLLKHIGEDPDREGLRETPSRVLRAWQERTSGYGIKPEDVLKWFEDGAKGCDELVIVHNIPVISVCVLVGTMVETPRGPVPINFLKNGDWIYTVDPKTLMIKIAKCKNPRMTQKNAKLVRVYCDHDTLVCTPDHKILTYYRGWVEAKDLLPSDRIVSVYRSVHKEGRPFIGGQGGKTRKNSEPRFLKFNRRAPAGAVYEHDLVATQFYGRGGKRYSRIIHHEDECVWNNVPENLAPVSIKEHNKRHQRFKDANTKGTPEYEKRLSGVIKSTKDPKVRAKRSISVKKHWSNLSEVDRKERCNAMSEGIRAVQNHIVIGVEHLTERGDVWCMGVPGMHTFFANRMAVHNCEHHLADIVGHAHVGYIPDGRIVGLSKLARLVDIFARRLQVQEALTVQIAEALMQHLSPLGVGVLIRASHACMSTRGINVHGSVTTTSAMRGVLLNNSAARKEFLDLCMMAEKDR